MGDSRKRGAGLKNHFSWDLGKVEKTKPGGGYVQKKGGLVAKKKEGIKKATAGGE